MKLPKFTNAQAEFISNFLEEKIEELNEQETKKEFNALVKLDSLFTILWLESDLIKSKK